MRKWIAVAAVGMVALAGCSGEGGSASSPSSVEGASGEVVEDLAGTTGAPETAPDATFGETFTYPDGTAVSVGAPEPFTPSAAAVKGGEPDFVTLEITVVNGTSEDLPLTDFTVTAQSGGGEGGDVLDPENGISGVPAEPVAPGGEVSWAVAFGVLDAQDVIVTVLPGIDSDPVAFGG